MISAPSEPASTAASDVQPAPAAIADTKPADSLNESVAVEPQVQPKVEPVAAEPKLEPVAVEPKLESVAAFTADVPLKDPSSNNTPSNDTAAAEPVAPQAVSEPSAVENAPALVEDETGAQPVPEAASASDATVTTGSAAEAVQPAEQAHADTLAEVPPPVVDPAADHVSVDTAAAQQQASLPADVLPPVSVRANGVPLVNVPQRRVVQEAAEWRRQPTTEANATVEADVPMTEGDTATGSVPAPTAEPIKRDPPTKLLPREHAAIESLY
jgi:hypothetical protein